MKAMILAAGRGERLRPHTDFLPKPLLLVAGKSLMVYQIEALKNSGICEIVINHAHLGQKIVNELGDGQNMGVHITYSDEGAMGLETGGGIFNALTLLGDAPFVVVNGDIWTDFDYSGLPVEPDAQAHLVLVENPQYKSLGDFSLVDNQLKELDGKGYTFSGIGVYRAEFFQGCKAGRFPLAPLIREKIKLGLVSGELHQGAWCDVGTSERLVQLDSQIRNNVF